MLYNAAYNNYLEGFARHIGRLGYTTSSISTLYSCVKEFLHWLEQKALTQITILKPSHIKGHYSYLQQRPNQRRGGCLSSSLVAFHIYAIRLFLEYLQQEGILEADPMGNLSFERAGYKEREILTREEIQQLYNSCENLRDAAMLSLLYGCGLRSSEASGLDTGDIHFRPNILFVRQGKGGKRREVPMGSHVTEHLKAYYYNHRPVYINPACSENAFLISNAGTRASKSWLWLRIKYLAKKAGIKNKNVTLHTLRHTIATHLLENGMSVEYIRAFLGHRCLESTQIYTRIISHQINKQHGTGDLAKSKTQP